MTGTIAQNGVSIQPFTATAAGTVTADPHGPDPQPPSRLDSAWGLHSGTTCQVVLDNPVGVQGSILRQASRPPDPVCVRIYDVGAHRGGTTVSYTVTVVHH